MVAGFDRYFQIARCFRDEDLRNDRQPEFTQIDLEASFVGVDDVIGYVEQVLVALWTEAGQAVARPFPRLTWRDAMERYGTDKPDLRFGFSIADWTRRRRRLTPSAGGWTFPCSSPIPKRGSPCSRTTPSRPPTRTTSPGSTPIRSPVARCTTTPSTTATSWGRARSGSRMPPCSAACSPIWGWRRRRRRRGSASC